MKNTVHLQSLPHDLSAYDHLIISGFKDAIDHYVDKQFNAHASSLSIMMQHLADQTGGQVSGFVQDQKLTLLAITEKATRMNCMARPDYLAKNINKVVNKKKRTLLIICPTENSHIQPLALATARAFPIFSCKQGQVIKHLDLAIVDADALLDDEIQSITDEQIEDLQKLMNGVQRAALLVDTPPDRLNVNEMVETARQVAVNTGSDIDIFSGDTLKQMGMGGLSAVGQAAVQAPACVILRGPKSSSDAAQMVWVGKGVMYDTGGLSLKPKNGMGGMKMDMGGSAAVLAAFEAAALRGLHYNVCAVLCLAENAIGPHAVRNDDIITIYSGKTVEINNTDAEGRLVLGDGVAYAAQHLDADVIIDVATLTGAQLVATGKTHAAIVCNDADLENHTVALGKKCGDLVHPLPYCPELFIKEFKSEVADMKNSVKDRMNAQSSCAGHFVEAHLSSENRNYEGQWLHIDIAGPAFSQERGTGYGVALLNALADSWQKDWV
jgi:probable aminopeptidase NPEPL1